MKEEKLQLIPQKYKDCKKVLWTNICQEIGQPGWNGQISRNIQSAKPKPRRSRKSE